MQAMNFNFLQILSCDLTGYYQIIEKYTACKLWTSIFLQVPLCDLLRLSWSCLWVPM